MVHLSIFIFIFVISLSLLDSNGVGTTSSTYKHDRLLNESDSGSNVIIGFLDTGIYPEHPSFHDDPQELGPIPSKWKGACLGLGDSFTSCNNKIIGARFFPGTNNGVDHNAIDTTGHGTAMASIAAGRKVSLLGHAANRTIVGVAPKARIAVYKVCSAAMVCSVSNILSGIDSAVEDGVDVISLSLSKNIDDRNYWDLIAIGAFGAMEKGVLVIVAAGNDGPTQGSVENVAPWMLTVGATAMKVIKSARPVVPSFSGRGPSSESSHVLKPDLVAPGVNIIAAALTDNGTFTVQSGTSISSAHVAGVAALLKGAHPKWSPAMIRSAMMTTAYTHDKDGRPILDEDDHMEATPWAMGAGHVDPEKAVDPGLVYDITRDGYVDFLCAKGYIDEGIRNVTKNSTPGCSEKQRQMHPWNLNYPAISIEFSASGDHHFFVVKRTVTHVGECPANYTMTVTNPKSGRISVTVVPMTMEFKRKGEKKSYNVTIKAVSVPPGVNLDVGKIVWLDSNGRREVMSPVVVEWSD